MSAVLVKKGHAALDDDIRGRETMQLWDELTAAFDLEIKKWNRKCARFDAETDLIVFYPRPHEVAESRKLAEDAIERQKPSPSRSQLLEWLQATSSLDAPKASVGSVCAESVQRDDWGQALQRVYIWASADDIRYSYGRSWHAAAPTVLSIEVDAGIAKYPDGAEDKTTVAQKTAREIVKRLVS
jgi:hypothetical protein